MINPAQACMNCLTENIGICFSIQENTAQFPQGLFSNQFLGKIQKICSHVCRDYFSANQVITIVNSLTEESCSISYIVKGEGGPLFETASRSLKPITENLQNDSFNPLPVAFTALAVGIVFCYCFCAKEKQD